VFDAPADVTVFSSNPPFHFHLFLPLFHLIPLLSKLVNFAEVLEADSDRVRLMVSVIFLINLDDLDDLVDE